MAVQLTQQDVMDLRKMGYTDEQIRMAVTNIEKEDLQKGLGVQKTNPRLKAQHSAFGSRVGAEDLVRWQLELNDILERAEHILRGDIIHFEDNQVIWKKNPNPKNNCLNDFGVQKIMEILAQYINRNTILSDYTQDEINYKVFDFGREINNLFFMKYEEFGMDTEDKRKEYPMLVREIVDIVHSSYKRALEGGERRSLREMIQIQQSHQLMAQGGMTVNPTGTPQQIRGIVNPMRYLKGKYV